MLALAGSFAATPFLLSYPVYAGQSLRYAAATAVLTGTVYVSRHRHVRPTPVEWLGLTAIAILGLVLFNVALLEGLRHLQPAAMGTVVGASPLILATLGPLVERRPISPRVLGAAAVAVVGSVLTCGASHASGRGLAWAIVVLSCESAFSLLAVPLLPRLGSLVLSAHVTAIAAAILGLAAVAARPHTPFPVPNPSEGAALVYLALVVTAAAFLGWYTGVQRLGSDRAGIFLAILPVASALCAAALGTGTLTTAQLAGSTLVALGLVAGNVPWTGTRLSQAPHESEEDTEAGRRALRRDPFAEAGTPQPGRRPFACTCSTRTRTQRQGGDARARAGSSRQAGRLCR